MSVTGAVVDIVGAYDGPEKLLEDIVFFVGAAGRGQTADGIGAMLFFDIREAGDDEVEGLIPAGRRKITIFGLPDQRGFQPIGPIDKFVTEPAFGAKPSLIVVVGLRGYPNHPVTNGMKSDIAAAAAVGANGIGTFYIFLAALSRPYLAGKGTGGTDGDALTTELTIQILVIWRADLGIETTMGEIDTIDTLYFITDPDAQTTENAFVHFPFDKRIMVEPPMFTHLAAKTVMPYLIKIGLFLEGAVTGPGADHTVIGMV